MRPRLRPRPRTVRPSRCQSAGASPEKVEDAKSTAKAAKLTPLVPSPRNPLRPAFQLYAEIDLPILGIGLVFESARLFRPQSQKAFCAHFAPPAISMRSIARRRATGARAGRLPRTMVFTPSVSGCDLALRGRGALAGPERRRRDRRVGAGRNRRGLRDDARSGPAASLSLWHEGAAFRTQWRRRGTVVPEQSRCGQLRNRDIHVGGHATASPPLAGNWIVLGVGGAIASFVATARVLGGMHFISDVVGGAVVGSSLGVIIPSLHGSPVSIVPVAGDGGQRGIAVSARF